ncbi:response regulator [Pandoraea nosoerga]|uniref:histidine kinase n=1 Tax=Pandoraea nosoerga TaxID=2508296 RepID=A0A5E4SI45_9BURK|nr:sensor histidine kinase [Pandoraea nosoerga]MBN4665347.1 response regulator [Pandoraea nosoerga]MBN4680637.1 response regulator [Pandoraea nosoerga]MBN4744041.1 response regulator [Pandoraea nosoerga]VVD74114.1 Sensory/regulatory protein RpfC [Pandoraea nosoerga]
MTLDNFKSLRDSAGAGRGEHETAGSGNGLGAMADGMGLAPGAAHGTAPIDIATFRLALVHELRAPLQVLQGHLDALCAQAECDEAAARDTGRGGGGDEAGAQAGEGGGRLTRRGLADVKDRWAPDGGQVPIRQRVVAMRNMLDAVASAVDDVLELGQGDVVQLPLREAPFEVRACLDEEVGWFAAKARAKHLDLTCSIADDVPVMLHGDAARLRQILRVLIDNALKYTACGGVAIAAAWAGAQGARDNDAAGRIAARKPLRPCAGYLTLDVADTGPGVPAGMENAVFAAFSRADQEAPGAGLGLWIARQWAQRMGGVLRVEPSSTGARFQLCVPLAALASCAPSGPSEPPGSSEPPGPSELPGPSGPSADSSAAVRALPPCRPGAASEVPAVPVDVRRGLRAMVVDDHALNRAIVAEQLGALGCEVRCAADITEALLHWLRCDLDVVLTDVQLGDGSGLTLARTLRALAPVLARDVPVVLAITGSVVSARAAREASLDGVLTKPVSRHRLARALAARWPAFGQMHGAQDSAAGEAAGDTLSRGAAVPAGARSVALKDDPYARRLMRDEMAKDLARFRRLLAGRREEDLRAAQAVVHRMRGACRMFGDPVLVARCERLAAKLTETLVRSGAAPAGDDGVDQR